MNKDIWNKNLMVVYMILFSLIVEVIGMLLVSNKLSFTMGLLFGLIFSILKLKLMQNTIEKAVRMPEGKAQKYMNGQYMIRYILTGIVLVVAALEPSVNLLGVFLGLVSMKVAAYMQLFQNKKYDGKQESGK